jgi:hypothetical protein
MKLITTKGNKLPTKKKLTNLYHKQHKWLTKEPMKWIGDATILLDSFTHI